MSRRRYISTEISLDTAVNTLALEYGDFAVLLYTWMIPHAEEDATIHGDVSELLLRIAPGRRDKSEADVAAALAGMDALGLIKWNRERAIVLFPTDSFYRYQSNVNTKNRRVDAENGAAAGHLKTSAFLAASAENQQQSAENAEERRRTPKNAASVSPSPSLSPSVSPSVQTASVSPESAEVDAVLDLLDTTAPEPLPRTDTNRAGIWKAILDHASVDPLEVTLDYLRWQETLPHSKKHRDVLRGWRNQMRMRDGRAEYERPSPSQAAGHVPPVPRVPIDLLERTKQRSALIEGTATPVAPQ